jgi:hypothetical protein
MKCYNMYKNLVYIPIQILKLEMLSLFFLLTVLHWEFVSNFRLYLKILKLISYACFACLFQFTVSWSYLIQCPTSGTMFY